MKRHTDCPAAVVSPVYINGTAWLRALARRGAYCVAVASSPDVEGFSSRYAHEKVLLPNFGDAPGAFTEWLLSRADLYGALVIPTGDEVVVELDRNRDALCDKFRLCIPPRHACAVALDKSMLDDVCRQAAIPAPKTVHVGDSTDVATAGGLGFPVIVKPCYGIDFQRFYSGDKVIIVEDPETLQKLVGECRDKGFDIVLQELLPREGAIAAYSAYVDRSGRIAGDYTSRRICLWPPHWGVGMFEVSEHIEQILDAGRRFIKAVGYAGAPINIDFKLDTRDGVYKLLDPNARSWRQVAMAPAVGIDVFEMLARDYLDEAPLAAAPVRQGRYWLAVRDALLVRRAFAKDSPSMATYLKCLARPTTLALFDLRDPLPALREMLPLFTRRLKVFKFWKKG